MQALGSVSHKDKLAVAQQLSEVFLLANNEMKSFEGYGQFIIFVEKWESKYPALRKYKAERNSAYFTYMDSQPSAEVHIYDQLD